MKILARIQDEGLRAVLADTAARLNAEIVDGRPAKPRDGSSPPPDVMLVEVASDADVDALRSEARRTGAALLLACHPGAECPETALADADDWILMPARGDELEFRLRAARQRATGAKAARETAEAAELVRYEELLYDKLTGFPTLPVMIERARELLERRGELTVLYIHFVWYEKIEEIYGWQKLDDVLETTAGAVREFYSREHAAVENIMMVSHIADDDFILFTHVPVSADLAERRLRAVSQQLENFLRETVEQNHGEDLATLCGI
ncbi:MAG: hypothetical protein ACRELX_03430, partial [Longimicrobiales bacterium]